MNISLNTILILYNANFLLWELQSIHSIRPKRYKALRIESYPVFSQVILTFYPTQYMGCRDIKTSCVDLAHEKKDLDYLLIHSLDSSLPKILQFLYMFFFLCFILMLLLTVKVSQSQSKSTCKLLQNLSAEKINYLRSRILVYKCRNTAKVH